MSGAVEEVRAGMSKKRPVEGYQVPRSSLAQRLLGKHMGSVGHLTVISRTKRHGGRMGISVDKVRYKNVVKVKKKTILHQILLTSSLKGTS